MLKISIIVPIYNVEPYLGRCLSSVAAQTYRGVMECLLVDDCGTDRSMEIATRFVKEYTGPIDFKILHHDHNRGLSAARNTGMDAATGAYVYFLDSDDEITPDCIEKLAAPLMEKEYDMVVGNYQTTGTDKSFPPLRMVGEIVGGEALVRSYQRKDWYQMAWNKLFCLSYLRGAGIRFLEGLIHEDELWSFQVACTAKSLFCIGDVSYIYHVREDSIVTAKNIDVNQRKIAHLLVALKNMYLFQESKSLFSTGMEGLLHNARCQVARVMTIEHWANKRIYLSIRQADTRSYETKRMVYPMLKQRILHLHVFLPSTLGYLHSRFMRGYARLRTGRKSNFYY